MPSNKTSPAFFYPYVLRGLKDGDNYVGYTNNLKKRLEERLKGKGFATRHRRLFKPIYFEACLASFVNLAQKFDSAYFRSILLIQLSKITSFLCII